MLHISKSDMGEEAHVGKGDTIEMSCAGVASDSSVVIVDDVLATGATLCTVLKLLVKVGAKPGNVTVMVVAEFPVHRGRERVLRSGYGQVRVQSLLVFGGA